LTLRVEPLNEHHHLDGFRCGNPDLDEWLCVHARTATGQGTRTYVLLDDDDRVVGYFAIAPHTIDRDDLSRKVGRGAPRHIPAILLAKLALTDDLHGERLGSELLIVALDTTVEAARRAGGKLVVVDAIDDTAAGFYIHHEFETVPGNAHRLVRKLSTIACALGHPWP
jgi:GNAT superfamily N-acetyltransferase